MLNDEGSKLINVIKQEWSQLLSSKNNDSNLYCNFLANHATLFFQHFNQGARFYPIVISDVKLNHSITVDFVVAEDKYTEGINYHIIKIGTPHESARNKSGAISKTLSKLIKDIELWNNWINTNPSKVQSLFPSRKVESFKYWIFTGMEYTFLTSRSLDNRIIGNYISGNLCIQIEPFTYFTNSLEHLFFYDTLDVSTTQWESVSLITKNKLANPFFKALSQDNWIKMVRHPNFSTPHLISDNAELLLQYLEDNGSLDKFLELWWTLPENKRKNYIDNLGKEWRW